MASLQGLDDAGRVIYVETFSKVLFPGLRLGYAVMPTPLSHVFQAARFLADRFAPTLLQAALCEFIPRGLRHAVLTAKYRSQAPYSGSSFGQSAAVRPMRGRLSRMDWRRNPLPLLNRIQ